MRIADITTFYSPSSGGVKTYITQKMDYARKSGFWHLVIVPGDRDLKDIVGVTGESSGDGCGVPLGTIFSTVRSPVVPFAKPYRLILRKGYAYEMLKDFNPDVVEAGCPYMLPWLFEVQGETGLQISCLLS